MTIPLLTTKLYIPPIHRDLVVRRRLLASLKCSLDCRLTLVSAPAGFGKTTLVSAWVATADRPTAWVSLDEGDNDPARFWAYVVAALQTVQPAIGSAALALLQATPPAPAEALMATLINDIAERAPALILVLDDYHVIKAPAIHEALSFLLDHQPSQLHLVIATRSDPPVPLSRLRGRRQMVELRADDLRFTPEEAAAFLNQVMGLNLASADIAALENRTEGWITGLQMAAFSLRGREDTSGFIADFAGTHRFILDYLLEEVLERAPEHIQTFLVETAILDRLTGPLCDAVTGRDDGQSLLAQLEADNLFIVPLDDRREWYRYHRLFADLLRARAEVMVAERLPELHRRAGAWYEAHGATDDAVKHALAAGDLARVADLAEAHGLPMLLRGELNTLLGWIAALPETLVLASPRLCVYHAWALLLTGQLQNLEPRLQRAERLLQARPVDDLAGHIAAIRAYAAALRNDVCATIATARLALEQLDPDNLSIRGVVSFVLGAACMLRSDVAGAVRAFSDASTMGQAGGNLHIAVPALNALAEIQIQQGRLRQAEMTAREALRLASDPSGRPLPIAGGVFSTLAELSYEWNDPEAALSYARQGVEQSRRWGNVDPLLGCYLTLALLQAWDTPSEAAETLQEAEKVLRRQTAGPMMREQISALRTRIWLAEGNLTAAVQWADEHEATLADSETCDEDRLMLEELERLTLARVRIAQGRAEAALRALAPLLPAARAAGLIAVVIEALALKALAHHAQGSADQALSELAEALALAEPEGYIRLFVDAGPATAALLYAALRQNIAPDYARTLLAAFEGLPAVQREAPHPAAATPTPIAHLIEPLSERELEVLMLVAEGMSNREIADALYIAESTVKSHINTIFRKLDVKSRTQAVARAQVLHLV